MRHVIRRLISGVVFLIFAACGSSRPAPKSKDDAEGRQPVYQLDYTDVMEFTRGVAGSYRLAGSFVGEKPARITIDGLPEGAVYENEQISWTPSCDLKPENGQFLHGYLVRRLRISLISNVSDDLVQKPAIMVVHKDGPDSSCQ